MKTNNLIKLLTLIVLSVLTVTNLANAAQFNYTGNYAYNFGMSLDNPYYVPWSGPVTVGGPVWADTLGYASQFTLANRTAFSSIDVNAIVLAGAEGDQSTPLVYKLYTNSTTNTLVGTNKPIPDINSLFFTSNPVSFQSDPNHSQNISTSVPFNTQLDPGTYWLAEQGKGSTIVRTSQTYTDPPIDSLFVYSGTPPVEGQYHSSINTIATPEPSTIVLLFLGGAPLLFWRVNRV